MHHLRQAIWGLIWKYTAGKSQITVTWLLATLALSEDSTIKETNRQTNKPMLWSDTMQFIIFPSRLITRCQWSRHTVNHWGGGWGRGLTLSRGGRPSSSTPRRSFCKGRCRARGRSEDLDDDTTSQYVAEQPFCFWGAVLIGRSPNLLLSFLFGTEMFCYSCQLSISIYLDKGA